MRLIARRGCLLLMILLSAWLANGFIDVRAGVPTIGPMQIVHCVVNRRLGYVDPYESLSITFINRRDAPADDVHFVVQYAGHTAQLDDRGAFSKDVKIEHVFRAFWNLRFAGSEPTSCVADYVHFRDGSSWSSNNEGGL